MIMNGKLLLEHIMDYFSNRLNVCVMIYLDDLLIYSNNMSKHCWHIKEVLKYFYKANIYTKVEKCKFYFELVEYLEYILSSSGLSISDNKVKIIQDQMKPKKIQNIQSFLSFANFYHWFIFNYLDIVILLTCLTWKDISWKLNFFCHNTFKFLKKAFIFAPNLIYQISDTQLIMENNISNYALTSIVNK